jgi:Tol biopolymer transport system component
MYFLPTRRPARPAPRHPMPQPLLPGEIASAPQISSLKLSSSTEHVVYCVAPSTHAGPVPTSALWIANTSRSGSARPLTSGFHNDRNPAFHPTSDGVFFLSDRHTVGVGAAIYSLHRDAAPGTGPRRVSPAGVT